MRVIKGWKLVICLAVLGVIASRASAAPFDQQFIDSMMPHHQSAVVMAEMAVKQARHPEVRHLARQIIQAQQREMQQMKAWRQAWFGSAEVPMVPGMQMGKMVKMTMPGMMMGLPMQMEMDMNKLHQARGNNFDRMFLEMMVPHHAGAMVMAQEALTTTRRPELRHLAHRIIDSQAREIGMMRALHQRWYGAL